MFDALARNTLVPLVLRLGLAVIFIYHGYHKVEHDWGTTWADKMPNPPTEIAQLAVAWGELLGGSALALGFLTRWAALGLAAIMIGAIVTVHWPRGFDNRGGGYEYNFAILVICAAVFLLGGGTLAVDHWFRRGRKPS